MKLINHPLYGKISVTEANAILRTEYGEQEKIKHRISILETLLAEVR